MKKKNFDSHIVTMYGINEPPEYPWPIPSPEPELGKGYQQLTKELKDATDEVVDAAMDYIEAFLTEKPKQDLFVKRVKLAKSVMNHPKWKGERFKNENGV